MPSISKAWIVNSPELAVSCAKPSHVTHRFQKEHIRNKEHEAAVAKRRQQRIKKRQEKCSKNVSRVLDVAAKRLCESALERAEISNQLEAKVSAVNERRERKLEAKRKQCVEHWRYALHVRARAAEHRAQRKKVRSQSQSSRKIKEKRETDLLEHSAAISIQKWYRNLRLKRAARHFAKGALLAAGRSTLESHTYEELMVKLHDKSTLVSCSRLFRSLQPYMQGKSTTAHPHRVFLSSFMMVHHPHVVFSSDDESVSSLKETATVMLEVFHQWMAQHLEESHDLDGTSCLNEFAHTWDIYVTSFMAWKKLDAERLVSGLVAHHRELTSLRHTVAGQGESNSPQGTEWCPHIDKQQDMIEKKLHSLGALKRLRVLTSERRAAVEDSETSGMDESEDERYRTVSGGDMSSRSTPDIEVEPGTVPRSVSTTDRSALSTSLDQALSQDETDSEANSEMKVEERQKLPRGIDQSVLDGLVKANIAHEIAWNEDFYLKEPKEDVESMEYQFKQQMERAFFDTIREDMEGHNPSFDRLLGVVEEVRDGLMAVTLPRQEKLRDQLNTFFDIPHMRQQLVHGAFDFTKHQSVIKSILASLCAACRDQDVKELAEKEDVCTFYKATLDLLKLMRMDMANFFITTLRPMIKDKVVEIERKNFKAGLDSGAITLDNTRKWLSEFANGNTGSSLSDRFNEALSVLIFDEVSDWPETWQMDKERILDISRGIEVCTLTAAVHTLATSIVPSMRELKLFEEELESMIPIVIGDEGKPSSRMAHVALQTVSLVNSSLEKIVRPRLTEEQAVALREQLERLEDSAHPVINLLKRRISDGIKKILGENSKKAADKNPFGRNSGLAVVTAKLSASGSKLAQLSSYNRAVYASHYDGILRQTMQS